MNLLVPYTQLIHHKDPCFGEYTYGDVRGRSQKLKKLKKGDYVFFHTRYNGRKSIMAYYVVDRILDVSEVIKDKNLCAKYSNPHINEYASDIGSRRIDNVILFGDPISSKILEKPLLFDRKLAAKLSLKNFFPQGRTETQAIGSATRNWRNLNDKDIEILFEAIKESEATAVATDRVLSTEEVTEILERDIESFIKENPQLMGRSVKIIERQLDTSVGRIDLLLQERNGNLIVVELKLGKIGHDAVKQIRRYIEVVRDEEKSKDVSGIIVCQGVMPAFQKELRKLKNIRIFYYGWQLKVYPWDNT